MLYRILKKTIFNSIKTLHVRSISTWKCFFFIYHAFINHVTIWKFYFLKCRCECTAGYTGPLCQHNLNECESSPCVHGICVDQDDGFRCFCQPGKQIWYWWMHINIKIENHSSMVLYFYMRHWSILRYKYLWRRVASIFFIERYRARK